MHPDRVVVGVQNDRAADVMSDVYRPLYLRDFPIMTTDLESAEMIKYAANAFLATKITFINEIAALVRTHRCRRKNGVQRHGHWMVVSGTNFCTQDPVMAAAVFQKIPKRSRALGRTIPCRCRSPRP